MAVQPPVSTAVYTIHSYSSKQLRFYSERHVGDTPSCVFFFSFFFLNRILRYKFWEKMDRGELIIRVEIFLCDTTHPFCMDANQKKMWCEIAGVFGVNAKLRHQVHDNSRYFVMCWNCTVLEEYWQFRQGAGVLAQWRFRNASTGRAWLPSVAPDSDSLCKKTGG